MLLRTETQLGSVRGSQTPPSTTESSFTKKSDHRPDFKAGTHIHTVGPFAVGGRGHRLQPCDRFTFPRFQTC